MLDYDDEVMYGLDVKLVVVAERCNDFWDRITVYAPGSLFRLGFIYIHSCMKPVL